MIVVLFNDERSIHCINVLTPPHVVGGGALANLQSIAIIGAAQYDFVLRMRDVLRLRDAIFINKIIIIHCHAI